jgi:hypothetical protein
LMVAANDVPTKTNVATTAVQIDRIGFPLPTGDLRSHKSH